MIGVLGVGGGTALLLSLQANLPPMIALDDYKPLLVSEVYDRHGKKIGEFFKQKRELVEYHDFPEQLKRAFIAAEDSKFWQHKGLHYAAMFRAFIANLKAGEKLQGASTITQQVARTLLLTREKTYVRKAKEILLAQQMEANLSKEDILYLYLNQIYLGHGAWGVGQAAQVYFRKKIQNLSLAEMAILAGLPKAPGRYTPLLNPQRAKQRQAYVLARMQSEDFITAEQAQAAQNEAVKIYLRQDYTQAPYYVESLRQVLVELVGEKALLEEGLQIYSSLDVEQQIEAQKSVRQGLRDLDKRQGYRGAVQNISDPTEVENFLTQSRHQLLRAYSDERWLLPEHLNTNQSVLQLVHKSKHGQQKEYHFIPASDTSEARNDNDNTDAPVQDDVPVRGDVPARTDVPVRGFANRPSYIKPNQIVQGVVQRVDDAWGLVQVRLADAQGLIDVETMAWARKPDPEVSYKKADPLTQPSRRLKKGDVILVKVVGDVFEPSEELKKRKAQHVSSKKASAQAERAQAGRTQAKSAPEPEQHNLDPSNWKNFMALELEQEPQAQSALMAFDQQTQDIVAMVGGYDFTTSKFNRTVQAARQTGSSFKPIVYLAALDKGYTPSSIIVDAPVVYEDEDDEEKKWRPQNDGRRFRGDVLFRNALIRSMNVPTLKIIEDIGVARVMDYARRLGVFSPLNHDYTLALGSSSVSLYEITKVFAQLGRGGKKITPRLILQVKAADGSVLLQNISLDYKFQSQIDELDAPFERRRKKYLSSQQGDDNVARPKSWERHFFFPNERQLISRETAFLATTLLQAAIEEPGGTGAAARSLGRPMAGKTGSTSDYYDAWFVGYTPDVATGVWVGYDQERSLGRGEVGGRAALPIWLSFMKFAHQNLPVSDFVRPDNIVFVSIDNQTGRVASADSHHAVRQAFIEGTEPQLEMLNDNGDEEQDFFKEDLVE